MPTINASESYALVSSYGIYDRDVAEMLNVKYPRASALSWMRAAKGYMGKRKVKQHTYSYWEENQWLNASAVVASAANSSADVVLTLDSTAHQNSGKESYPIVTDLVVFPDETVGYVIAVNKATPNAHTVTVRKVNASQDVQTAGAALGTVVFYSNAQQEKSTQTSSRIPKQTKISNRLQTFRAMYEYTDHAAQNETEWRDRKSGAKMLHIKGTDDTANKFAMDEELGMLITPESSGLLNAGSNAVQTTKALLPQIREAGGEFEYTTAPDIADVEDWIIAASDKYAGRKYVLGMGINIHVKWNSVMKDFMVNNPTPFFETVNDMSDGNQKYTFNFGSLQYGDFQLYTQKWDVLSHKDSLGATGHPYRDMMICLPIGQTTDPDSGESEPYIKIAYADPGGSPLENKGDYKLFETGANAKRGATDDEMATYIHWVSYKGFEIRHTNKFFVWTKA